MADLSQISRVHLRRLEIPVLQRRQWLLLQPAIRCRRRSISSIRYLDSPSPPIRRFPAQIRQLEMELEKRTLAAVGRLQEYDIAAKRMGRAEQSDAIRKRLWEKHCMGELLSGCGAHSSDCSYVLVILNYRLPSLAALLWQRARLRMCADGGANRLYNELPVLLGQEESIVREVHTGCDHWGFGLHSPASEAVLRIRSLGTAVLDKSHDQDTIDLLKCISFVAEKSNMKILVVGRWVEDLTTTSTYSFPSGASGSWSIFFLETFFTPSTSRPSLKGQILSARLKFVNDFKASIRGSFAPSRQAFVALDFGVSYHARASSRSVLKD
ncbi:hypothetical protein SELMODRAFT_425289 [Selaginella moellendorffii]|uniref:Thiamin pyrophosphokinase catalytic domain-containing protein n=1 Tax=Selaginella moellendorffii TaxID=88036 RepID=D8SSM2_SELML|nr:hypothetical protein SELMODRAFT_425289 [Selaginella moellendorffii]